MWSRMWGRHVQLHGEINGTLVIFKDRVELDGYNCTQVIPEVIGTGLSHTGKPGIDLYSNRNRVQSHAKCTHVRGEYIAILTSAEFLDWDDEFRSQHSYHYQWSVYLEPARLMATLMRIDSYLGTQRRLGADV